MSAFDSMRSIEAVARTRELIRTRDGPRQRQRAVADISEQNFTTALKTRLESLSEARSGRDGDAAGCALPASYVRVSADAAAQAAERVAIDDTHKVVERAVRCDPRAIVDDAQLALSLAAGALSLAGLEADAPVELEFNGTIPLQFQGPAGTVQILLRAYRVGDAHHPRSAYVLGERSLAAAPARTVIQLPLAATVVPVYGAAAAQDGAGLCYRVIYRFRTQVARVPAQSYIGLATDAATAQNVVSMRRVRRASPFAPYAVQTPPPAFADTRTLTETADDIGRDIAWQARPPAWPVAPAWQPLIARRACVIRLTGSFANNHGYVGGSFYLKGRFLDADAQPLAEWTRPVPVKQRAAGEFAYWLGTGPDNIPAAMRYLTIDRLASPARDMTGAAGWPTNSGARVTFTIQQVAFCLRAVADVTYDVRADAMTIRQLDGTAERIRLASVRTVATLPPAAADQQDDVVYLATPAAGYPSGHYRAVRNPLIVNKVRLTAAVKAAPNPSGERGASRMGAVTPGIQGGIEDADGAVRFGSLVWFTHPGAGAHLISHVAVDSALPSLWVRLGYYDAANQHQLTPAVALTRYGAGDRTVAGVTYRAFQTAADTFPALAADQVFDAFYTTSSNADAGLALRDAYVWRQADRFDSAFAAFVQNPAAPVIPAAAVQDVQAKILPRKPTAADAAREPVGRILAWENAASQMEMWMVREPLSYRAAQLNALAYDFLNGYAFSRPGFPPLPTDTRPSQGAVVTDPFALLGLMYLFAAPTRGRLTGMAYWSAEPYDGLPRLPDTLYVRQTLFDAARACDVTWVKQRHPYRQDLSGGRAQLWSPSFAAPNGRTYALYKASAFAGSLSAHARFAGEYRNALRLYAAAGHPDAAAIRAVNVPGKRVLGIASASAAAH